MLATFFAFLVLSIFPSLARSTSVGCDSSETSRMHHCNYHGDCTRDCFLYLFDCHLHCHCLTGYSGTHCEKFSCYGLASTNPASCGTHGTCSSPNDCDCDTGFLGSKCNTWDCFGVPKSDSSVCGAAGTCVYPNLCECETGYSAPQCNVWYCGGIERTNASFICNDGHGTCVGPDQCQCRDGWAGPTCGEISCFGVVPSSATQKQICSGHGTCVGPNSCECETGYSGPSCDVFSCFGVDVQSPEVCHGHGTCVAENRCECSFGYSGGSCESWECFGIQRDRPTVCFGHGKCEHLDECVCRDSYYGPECGNWNCFGKSWTDADEACGGTEAGECVGPDDCVCEEGYTGDQCQEYDCRAGEAEGEAVVCSDHGECIGPRQCSCEENYSGEDCSMWMCGGVSRKDEAEVCSAHGRCEAPDECRCVGGYGGDVCDEWACYGLDARYEHVCGGRGDCVELDVCRCTVANVSGKTCDEWFCAGVSRDQPLAVCSGHGICTEPETCSCIQNWRGDLCQILTTHRAVEHPSNVAGAIAGSVIGSFVGCFCCVGITAVVVMLLFRRVQKIRALRRGAASLGDLPDDDTRRRSSDIFPLDQYPKRFKQYMAAIRRRADEEAEGVGGLMGERSNTTSSSRKRLFGNVDSDIVECEDELDLMVSDLRNPVLPGEGRLLETTYHGLRVYGQFLEDFDAFRSEATRLLALFANHPKEEALTENLVKVVGFYAKGTQVMRYCILHEYHDLSLQKFLEEDSVSEESRLFLLLGVARAVRHLHNLGYVHRAVTMDSVVVNIHGGALLKPFGDPVKEDKLSRSSAEDGEVSIPESATRYCAPEMFSEKGYDRKIDVFAFGILMYEVLENRRIDESAFSYHRMRSESTYRPKVTNDEWGEIVRKCWAHEPSVRPDFGEIVGWLESHVDDDVGLGRLDLDEDQGVDFEEDGFLEV